MIELKNVCYAYGNEIALRYINLNIQKGVKKKPDVPDNP